MNTIKADTLYKINPEFDEWESDTYKLQSAADDGMYFYRFVDGGHQASELAFFNSTELADGVLIEAKEVATITEIKAHGSELGDWINGKTFSSITQADAVIMGLIKALEMGFAKTKITITWSDGETMTTDSDYCEGETTRDSLNYLHKKYNAPLEEWLKRMGISEEKHQQNCQEWAEFVATHEMP